MTELRGLAALALAALFTFGFTPRLAYGEDEAKLRGWAAFAEERRGICVGPAGDLDAPMDLTVGRHHYRLLGHRLIQTDHDRDRVLRIGVLSATKDDRPETLAAIKKMIDRLRGKHIDVLIANGDLATNEFEMETVFPAIAAADVLVLVVTGNTESCGSFNKIADSTFSAHPNFINGNWVRRLDLEDGTILTIPGYYDRRFTHTGGASTYTPDDLRALAAMAKDAPEPLVVVSHGPPKMSGKLALDVASEGGNVGDPAMTELIKDLKIPFGIFGHILEAGGRGTDLSGRKALSPKQWHPALYVNAGTLNPDPWRMLNGHESYGLGLYVEIERNRGRYEIERLPRPR